jgi:hypothetical protein
MNPNGRPKGTPNKTTIEFKQAVNNLLEFATPQMVEWLSRVAEADPSKALDHIGKLAEYAHPKLNRTELAGDKDAPVQHQHSHDLSAKLLKAIPQEQLDKLLAEGKD